MFTLGVDIGSTACKAVILENGGKMHASVVIPTGTGTSGPQRVYKEVLESAGLTPEEIAYTVATGYGRKTFEKAGKQVSELSCHARGVGFLLPGVRTIIDIGGQDAKTLKLDENGVMTDFVMNDKCAAGTGRFLDVMANVLEVGVGDLEGMGQKATRDVPISNICTVFAESEVISHLSANVDKNDIVAGIHTSIAKRVAGLARRVGITARVVMTGGVAQNLGVVQAMSDALGLPVDTPAPHAQLTGAIGAALYAYDEAQKSVKEKAV